MVFIFGYYTTAAILYFAHQGLFALFNYLNQPAF